MESTLKYAVDLTTAETKVITSAFEGKLLLPILWIKSKTKRRFQINTRKREEEENKMKKRIFPKKKFSVKLMILMGFQSCNKSSVVTSLPQVDKITATDSLFWLSELLRISGRSQKLEGPFPLRKPPGAFHPLTFSQNSLLVPKSRIENRIF